MTAASDTEVVDGWWREVLATGSLPAAARLVRGRLVRQVGSAELPSGRAFLKVMSFPRGKDRMRYLLRGLPAVREAAMLRAVAALGVPCPEVLAVRTARRAGIPYRSMLVLRELPVAGEPAADASERLRQRARLARRLLDGGLYHPDLNPDNFVALPDGELAVLDLQSMRRTLAPRAAGRAMAARLLLEAGELAAADACTVLASTGLMSAGDRRVPARAAREACAWLRQRVRRCLQTSTEFVRNPRGAVLVEHRRRGELPPGRWHRGGRDLLRCWVGQRLLEICAGRPPLLPAFRRKRWWLPGARYVYIPGTVAEESVREELRVLNDGFSTYRWLLGRGQPPDLQCLQRYRTRLAAEARR